MRTPGRQSGADPNRPTYFPPALSAVRCRACSSLMLSGPQRRMTPRDFSQAAGIAGRGTLDVGRSGVDVLIGLHVRQQL